MAKRLKMVADVIEIPAPNSIWIVQVDSFVLVFAVLGPRTRCANGAAASRERVARSCSSPLHLLALPKPRLGFRSVLFRSVPVPPGRVPRFPG